jgi:hypothetical protein
VPERPRRPVLLSLRGGTRARAQEGPTGLDVLTENRSRREGKIESMSVRPMLGRCTRRRQGELGRTGALDMLENPSDDERAVNAGDDLDRPAAAFSGHDLRTQSMVGRKDPVKAREVRARAGN